MIKQLQGTVLDVQDQYIVIEPSQGIGLQVFVPDPVYIRWVNHFICLLL